MKPTTGQPDQCRGVGTTIHAKAMPAIDSSTSTSTGRITRWPPVLRFCEQRHTRCDNASTRSSVFAVIAGLNEGFIPDLNLQVHLSGANRGEKHARTTLE
jgi:hypothetical protein